MDIDQLLAQHEIVYYVFTRPVFNNSLSVYTYKKGHNPVSGYSYSTRVLKPDHVSIQKRIDKLYKKWEKETKEIGPYSVLNAYPRTRKETDKINKRIEDRGYDLY